MPDLLPERFYTSASPLDLKREKNSTVWKYGHYTSFELLVHATAEALSEYLPSQYRDALFSPPVPQTKNNINTILFVGDNRTALSYDNLKYLNENLNWLVLDPHVWDLGWVQDVIKGYNGYVPLPYHRR